MLIDRDISHSLVKQGQTVHKLQIYIYIHSLLLCVMCALCVQIFICKIFIFEYFPKISSEMNSTHHFYLILIPNTSYGSQYSYLYIYIYLKIILTRVCKKIYLIKAKKYVVLGVPKLL